MEKRHPAAQRLGSPAEMAALTLPAEAIGAMFYDAVNSLWYYWDGSQWLPFGTGGGGAWPAPLKTMVGTTEYDTIQEAITAAAAWEVVKIGEGDYTENLVIDKAMTILAWPGTVTVYTDAEKGVNITVAGVVWDGPNVEHDSVAATTTYAIYFALGGTIRNCSVTNDSATDEAYAISAAASTITVENCIGSAGSAINNSYAVWADSAGVYLVGGEFFDTVAAVTGNFYFKGLPKFNYFANLAAAFTDGYRIDNALSMYAHGASTLQLTAGATVDSIVTTLGNPGTNTNLVTEAAIRTAIGSIPTGGGVWPKADKCNIDDTEYATFALLIAALGSGVSGRVGEGVFTSDGQTLPAGAYLEGSGIDVSELNTATNEKVLTISGGPVKNLTLRNTKATGTKYGLFSNSGSPNIYNIKAVLEGAGDYNYSLAFTFGGGVYNLFNCQSKASGASTFNYALYVDRCEVNLFDPVIEGDIYVYGGLSTTTVRIYGGKITGNITAEGAACTIELHNAPTIDGTLSVVSSGVIHGLYRNTGGNLTSIGGANITLDVARVSRLRESDDGADAWQTDAAGNLLGNGTRDIYPASKTQGLNTRFERLFGADVPATNYQQTFRRYRPNNLGSEIVGFDDVQTDYVFGAGSFSIVKPASAYGCNSVDYRHWLAMATWHATSPIILKWTNATAKNIWDMMFAFGPLAGTSDIWQAEIRFWGVQSPGAADKYFSIRLTWDGATKPQMPLRIKMYWGTGVTFAYADGTLAGNGESVILPGMAYRLRCDVVATSVFAVNMFAAEGLRSFSNYVIPAGWPSSFKEVWLRVGPASESWIFVDEIVVT